MKEDIDIICHHLSEVVAQQGKNAPVISMTVSMSQMQMKALFVELWNATDSETIEAWLKEVDTEFDND